MKAILQGAGFAATLAIGFAAEPAPTVPSELSAALGLTGSDGLKLNWTVNVGDAGGGHQKVEFTGAGPGVAVAGEAELSPATGTGTWRIADSRIDLAHVLPLAAPRAGGALDGFAASGHVTFAGSGRRTPAGMEGAIDFAVVDGGARNDAENVLVEGINLGAKLVSLSPLASAPAQVAQVRLARVAGVEVKDFRVAWELAADGTLRFGETTARVFDGAIRAEAVSMPLAAPAGRTVVRATGIAVGEIVKLLPAVLQDAQGRLDGEVAFGWSLADGFTFESGKLTLSEGKPVRFRLVPAPGLITNRLDPPGIKQWQLMLRKMAPGPVRMPTREDNPAYAPLRRVEMGETPIEINRLTAEFFGSDENRTVRLHLEGAPVDAQLEAPLIIDVNVAGPIDQILRIGLNEQVSFGLGK